MLAAISLLDDLIDQEIATGTPVSKIFLGEAPYNPYCNPHHPNAIMILQAASPKVAASACSPACSDGIATA